jgi:hypothetical protein
MTKDRAVEDGRRKADDISRQQSIDNLPSALVQERVADGKPSLDDIQSLVFITFDDNILALLYGQPLIEHSAQCREIIGVEAHGLEA